MKAYYTHRTGELYKGDWIECMRQLPDESINCCVTSPPYFGLRDYGVDGQAGLENTPDEYITNMVNGFREVRRILKNDGTLWVNIGDSYNGSGGNHKKHHKNNSGFQGKVGERCGGKGARIENLKPKDLIGIPWRLAFALQADGWYLRQDIIWHKPNPMPESVKDRCTKAHEYIFLLSKSPKYYFDHDAIKEPFTSANEHAKRKKIVKSTGNSEESTKNMSGGHNMLGDPQKGKNKRSVWKIATKSFKGAHFATFPPDLIRPCILAGCPKDGIVFDPFTGAGTTWIVAGSLQRRFTGTELNKEYCRIIIKRIRKELKQSMLF